MATVSHRTSPDRASSVRFANSVTLSCCSCCRSTFALLSVFVGYVASWPIGFDFRGTLWEPARALLDGAPIYPEPTREPSSSATRPSIRRSSSSLRSRSLSCPSTVAVVALVLPARASACSRRCGSSACATGAVTSSRSRRRSWSTACSSGTSRCSSSSRSRSRGGTATGRASPGSRSASRSRPSCSSGRSSSGCSSRGGSGRQRGRSGSAAVLVLGAWALIGFEGFARLPGAAARAYRTSTRCGASRSSTVAGGARRLGRRRGRGRGGRGLALLASRRGSSGGRTATGGHSPSSSRRASWSPIVWPNYARCSSSRSRSRGHGSRRRGSSATRSGSSARSSPKPAWTSVCCRPDDVPEQAWAWSHTRARAVVRRRVELVGGRRRAALRRGRHDRRRCGGRAAMPDGERSFAPRRRIRPPRDRMRTP